MEQPSLFTADESKAIKSSWGVVTADGLAAVGQLVLHRFYNDAPEVRVLFYKIGIDNDDPSTYSLEALKKNTQFTSHAKRVALAIDSVVKNIDNTTLITEKCTNLGKAHIKHKVKPQYFDLLGEALVKALCQALTMEADHPTIKAWIKAYSAIATAAKSGLSE